MNGTPQSVFLLAISETARKPRRFYDSMPSQGERFWASGTIPQPLGVIHGNTLTSASVQDHRGQRLEAEHS